MQLCGSRWAAISAKSNESAGANDIPAATAKQQQSVSAMEPELKRIMQAMTPAQKLRAAERLYYSARQLKAAALRAEHPDWSEEAIRLAVREIFLYARS